jgi:hypothetical protein
MMGALVVIALTIVAIVLIIGISINAIVDKQMREKRLRHEAHKPSGDAEFQAIAERTQMIEDRLRVLERIATDRGSLLADEIEALRESSRELAAPATRSTEEAVQ